jgi:glycosyltransferase involved in cell wall biosynthesis
VTKPDVSVILPCFNGRKWLRRSLVSVLDQKNAALELIVIDDGSEDPPIDICNDFRDERLRFVSTSHGGKGAALNRGAAEARAGILCFIDQDDIMLPGRLEGQLRALRSHRSVDAVYSDYERVFDDGRVIDRFVSRQATGSECLRAMATELSLVAMQTIMIRRDTFRRIGGFSEDPALTGLDDTEFFARLFVSDAKLHYEPGCVQQWVRHDCNYSQSEAFQDARLVLIGHLRALAGQHPQIATVLGRFAHDVHYMRGLYYLENNMRKKALPEFLRAVRSYPFFPNTYYLLLKAWLLRLASAAEPRTCGNRPQEGACRK